MKITIHDSGGGHPAQQTVELEESGMTVLLRLVSTADGSVERCKQVGAGLRAFQVAVRGR